MSWVATSAARESVDWLSFTITWMLLVLEPILMPWDSRPFRASMTYLSARPNGVSGPVSGLTEPILMTFWALEPLDLFTPLQAPAGRAPPARRLPGAHLVWR
jgi:hypothetical protein